MKTLKVTPKVKREIRDLSSLLTLLIATLFLLASLTSCHKEERPTTNCGTYATVKDLTGLDGCGFVFELENGEKLEPIRGHRCATPAPPASALDNFKLLDGQRVTIAYKEVENQVSICMVGKVVEITCINLVAAPQE